MSVLVKGMKIPINCGDCFLKVCYDYYYDAEPIYCSQILDAEGRMLKIGTVGKPMNDKHSRCPLVEVSTPHGRLIDADRLNKNILYAPIAGIIYGDGPFWTNIVYEKHINSAPTIIEAEDER